MNIIIDIVIAWLIIVWLSSLHENAKPPVNCGGNVCGWYICRCGNK